MKTYFSAAATKTGRRSNNQDNFMLDGKYAPLDHGTVKASASGSTGTPFFAVVADGMGGEASGETASFIACETLAGAKNQFKKEFELNRQIASETILKANDRICGHMGAEATERMGSTVIAVLLQDDKLYYTNLGDSRIYLLRDGVLTQLTHDHTEGQAMVDAGILTPEQLKKHPSRNKLSRHLGIFPDEMQLETAEYKDIELAAGDKLLLCSDGVFGSVEPAQLTELLMENAPVDERAMKLVDTAFANGSRDNMTALIIDISEGKKPVSKRLPIIIGAAAGAILLGLAAAFIIHKLKDNAEEERGPATPVEITDDAGHNAGDNENDPARTPETDPQQGNPTPGPEVTPGSSENTDPDETPGPTETEGPEDTEGPDDTDEPLSTAVSFSDKDFEAALRDRMGWTEDEPISATKLAGIRELDLSSTGIFDITDIAKLPNLEKLDLSENEIISLDPLSGLKNLKELNLDGNRIPYVSALAELTELEVLKLGSNEIVSVAPLAGLTKLKELNLGHNRIENIEPLKNMKALEALYLDNNVINSVAPLFELNGLKTLFIFNNGNIPQEQITELVEKLPECEIEY